MKWRKIASLILILAGLFILLGGVGPWIVGVHIPFSSAIALILGVIMIIAGVLIFITELFESWLSRSQAALVDGLQAG